MRSVSDEQMSVFAPTREAMEDVMERMETILQEEEEKEVRETSEETRVAWVTIKSMIHCDVLHMNIVQCLYIYSVSVHVYTYA